MQQNRDPIGGPGCIVEIDETLFTKRKNHAGRILPQQWVFGGICRETKQCFIRPVPKRDAVTLMPIIHEMILPGTTIMSDMWAAYNGINNGGFAHLTVNHSYNFVDPTSGAHTQNIERLWRSAKERNKRHCGTARALLETYMSEFMWRNVQDISIFDAILRDISAFMPPD